MSTRERRRKEALYAQLARVAKAMASPRRVELLDRLAQRPETVERLADAIGQSVAATSHHLQKLRDAHLVETEREAQFVRYRLADPSVARLLGALRATAHDRLAEVAPLTRELLGDEEPVTRLSAAELSKRVKDGRVVLLDVRPADEYRHGHLPGARSVPVSELKRRIDELDLDTDVVAYCRGPYCVMAVDAVRALRARGFRAHRLDEGVVEWQAAGRRLAKADTPGR